MVGRGGTGVVESGFQMEGLGRRWGRPGLGEAAGRGTHSGTGSLPCLN